MKTALITGGASGIGKACVEKMAREGYGVVIADVNLAGAEALAAQLTADDTLEERLERQRPAFRQTSGLTVV